MKLSVKNLDIETGGMPVVIINIKDAKKYDLHLEDRVLIAYKNRKLEAMIDIALHDRLIRPGQIGCFEEVSQVLTARNRQLVTIHIDEKPSSVKFIRKKLDGEGLSKKEIQQIVHDITHDKLSSVELAYFVAACYSRTMTEQETILLTQAMVDSGEVLKLHRYPILDKHCIGGVAANRTSMIVVPIIAAAGLTCPKTSSRSITSPAGTADTMEVLANVKVDLKTMKKIVEKIGACIIWGGALNLAPADDKIIRVERSLNIDAESQLIASIMAKKISVSSTHILIDIPVGVGAKVETMTEALNLKHGFQMIGERLKREITVLITDGSEPIGNGIGPILEARDVLWLLLRDPRAPKDLERKSIIIAGRLLEMAGISYGEEKARNLLLSGQAFNKMKEICIAQGLKTLDPEQLKPAKFTYQIKAKKSGTIKLISNKHISKIARVAGAPEHPGAGIYLLKHKGDKVKKNDSLCTLYSGSKEKLKYAVELLSEFFPFVIH